MNFNKQKTAKAKIKKNQIKSWADIVEEEENNGYTPISMPFWAVDPCPTSPLLSVSNCATLLPLSVLTEGKNNKSNVVQFAGQNDGQNAIMERQTTWASIVQRNLSIVDETEYEAQILENEAQILENDYDDTGESKVTKNIVIVDEHEFEKTSKNTYANILKSNLQLAEQSQKAVEREHDIAQLNKQYTKYIPGDPVGIREIQTILMSATQMNLSHFHTAGMDNVVAGRISPSAAETIDCVYTANNTSMTFKSFDDVYALRKQLVGKILMDFVHTVKSDITGFPDKENIWYEASDKTMYEGSILRIYINFNKMRNHGLTLEYLARESFGMGRTNVSPDFMGMIDVNVSDMYLSQWLARLGEKVCGTFDIKSCNKINDTTQQSCSVQQNCLPKVETAKATNAAITHGSNILAVSKLPSVDLTTINSNNALEVEEHYGVEAAASVIASLTGSHIVSDFMTRTGKIMPFTKSSIEVANKGLLTSMGFERPRDDIRKALVNQNTNSYSVYESIITGYKFSNIFAIE